MGLDFFVQLIRDKTFEVVDYFALKEVETGYSLVVASSRVENIAAASRCSLFFNLSESWKEFGSDGAIAKVEVIRS